MKKVRPLYEWQIEWRERRGGDLQRNTVIAPSRSAAWPAFVNDLVVTHPELTAPRCVTVSGYGRPVVWSE